MDDSAFPPNVATRLAVANHYGYAIRGGESREDAAVSALYLSKVQPGQYFLVRANRPGYVAEPTKLGKGRKGRRIDEQGLFAVARHGSRSFTGARTRGWSGLNGEPGGVGPPHEIPRGIFRGQGPTIPLLPGHLHYRGRSAL
jgi:hypothetical protein